MYPRSEVSITSIPFHRGLSRATLHRFTSNGGVYTSTWSSWLEQGHFPVHSDVTVLANGFLCTAQSTLHPWFRSFAGNISLSSKTTRTCHLLVHYGYRQSITQYLVSDVIKLHCLRVSRMDRRRIGKHSSSFVQLSSGAGGSGWKHRNADAQCEHMYTDFTDRDFEWVKERGRGGGCGGGGGELAQ